MANIVLNHDAGPVIKVGGICYAYYGKTRLNPTGQEPDEQFSTC
jgi:hypothetical protein